MITLKAMPSTFTIVRLLSNTVVFIPKRTHAACRSSLILFDFPDMDFNLVTGVKDIDTLNPSLVKFRRSRYLL
jgi:hypothetical protein